MLAIPADPARVQLLATGPAVPRSTRDGKQRTDAAGLPDWTVQVLMLVKDGRPEVVRLAVAAAANPLPAAPTAAPLVAGNLRAIVWEQDGRHGVAWRADALHLAPAQGQPSGPAPAAAPPAQPAAPR